MKTQQEIKFRLEELKQQLKDTYSNNELSSDYMERLRSGLIVEIKALKWVLNEK